MGHLSSEWTQRLKAHILLSGAIGNWQIWPHFEDETKNLPTNPSDIYAPLAQAAN